MSSLTPLFFYKRRLPRLSVGFPVSDPVTVLFNLLLSLTGKWHSRAEAVLRASSIDYTVLRPGGLSDETRETVGPPGSVALQLEATEPGSRSAIPAPGRIGRSDVASLAVTSLRSPRASRRTLSCRWVGRDLEPVAQGDQATEGSATWEAELAKLPECSSEDEGEGAAVIKHATADTEKSRPYALAVATTPPLFFAGVALTVFLVQKALRLFF